MGALTALVASRCSWTCLIASAAWRSPTRKTTPTSPSTRQCPAGDGEKHRRIRRRRPEHLLLLVGADGSLGIPRRPRGIVRRVDDCQSCGSLGCGPSSSVSGRCFGNAESVRHANQPSLQRGCDLDSSRFHRFLENQTLSIKTYKDTSENLIFWGDPTLAI
jgi:hypothetical protein